MFCLMKKIILFFLLFCSIRIAHAQNTFEKVIVTLGSTGASCVQETFDRGYILNGGSTIGSNEVLVMKLDSAGIIE